ncbi:HEXXH motif-containing putative peptide modification protein [Streptomyces globisporus]|uniref:aKG-HExxH-type peptide beta-hydroxylase n=1 Tax=Streptomyces globisporus TaxID=1908 RepID=UPI0036D87BC7
MTTVQSTAPVDFHFGPIPVMHQTRVDRIRALTPTRPDMPGADPGLDVPLAYAAAHHYLEGAEPAARAGDIDLFDWYQANLDAGTGRLCASTAVGPCAVITPNELITSPISDTPFYLLGPFTDPAAAPERALARAAYKKAADTGFADLVTHHARILVFLGRKEYHDRFDSWTISRLPGTVFLDHIDDPAALARDLIHEAGHNWLNDALTATNTLLPGDAHFPSPWKNTNRPAYGFLHACWAFPLTMIYTANILDQDSELSAAGRDFLTRYLDLQRRFLAPTADTHPQALTLIPDPDLRERLRHVHAQALVL